MTKRPQASARERSAERKPSLISARVGLAQVAAAAVIGSVAVTWLLAHPRPIWVTVAVITGIAIACFATVRGVQLVLWPVIVLRYLRRRRTVLELSEPVNITVAAGLCGVRPHDGTLISMIQLVADPTAPTILDETFVTADAVPIRLLGELMNQYGLELDSVTITTAGRRVPTGAAAIGYSKTYGERCEGLGVWTQGTTWLTVRTNPARNLEQTERRGPGMRGALKTHASATLRIAHQLRLAGHPCHTLSATEFIEAEELLTNADLKTAREQWKKLRSGDIRTEIFWATGAELSQLRTWMDTDAHDATICTRITRVPAARLHAAATVAYSTPVTERPIKAPATLTRSAGNQARAYASTLPTGSAVATHTPTDVLDVDGLTIPTGPTGQIVGIYQSRRKEFPVAMRLVDLAPIPAPQSSITIHSGPELLRQIVLRTAATGATVAIVTLDSGKWATLLAAIKAPSRVWLHEPEAVDSNSPARADLLVIDNGAPLPSSCSTARTVAFAWDRMLDLPRKDAHHPVRIVEDPATGAIALTTPALSKPLPLRPDRHPAERPFLK